MGFNIRRKGLPTGLWFPGFLVFIAVLWLAGGASRADVLGQAVVRATATIALIAVSLFAERPKEFPERPVLVLLLVSLVLVLVQLIPLPADIWLALPGRSALAPANAGQAIARPLSMVPGATANAAASLLVPLATFFLMLSMGRAQFRQVVTVLLALILISTLQGALQFSGVRFDNPLINDPRIDVVGPFANRNHFALMLAIGCLLLPVWVFLPSRPQRWRDATAIMALPLLLLVALASGSRAGLGLCCLGMIGGLAIVFRPLRARFRHKPAWVMPAMFGGAIVLAIGLIAIGMVSGRAVAIDRALGQNVESDIRFRAIPTVLSMVGKYLPWGSGFGGFDPLFRIHEPFALLKPTYFNHAHNDILEIAMDGGVPALILLFAAIGWWLVATVRACRAPSLPEVMLAKLGSAMLVLIFIASLVDYPARTPMIMAIIVVAAMWLSHGNRDPQSAALPERNRHL